MGTHHLDCGRLNMFGGFFIDGTSRGFRAPLTCHVLAVEDKDGSITLVDTGLGEQGLTRPNDWFGRGWTTMFAPEPDPGLTAAEQLRRAGLDPSLVRNVVLTHMDLDHVGGLADFPDATVHVSESELAGQRHPRNVGDRNRYRGIQFAHNPKWKQFDLSAGGDDWFGFTSLGDLPGLPDTVRVIDLAGHSNGHVGVAVQRVDGGWDVHAGDAYYLPTQMDPLRPRRTIGIAAFEGFASADAGQRTETQARLRELKRHHGDHVNIFCAHSMAELSAAKQLSNAPAIDLLSSVL